MNDQDVLLTIANSIAESFKRELNREIAADDMAHIERGDRDALAWVDRLEEDAGYSLPNLRADVIDYCLLRDDDPESSDVKERWGFRAFQASRVAHSDLRTASENIAPEWFDRQTAGFVYDGDCYIELNKEGTFTLTIFNDSETSDDLEKLERKLYQFAIDEQLFD